MMRLPAKKMLFTDYCQLIEVPTFVFATNSADSLLFSVSGDLLVELVEPDNFE